MAAAKLLVVLVIALFAAPIVAQSGFCTECQKVVAWLENELASNSTVQELQSALQTVCGLLPASEQGTCQNIVDKYLPDAINWVISRVTPLNACTDIHLCNTVAAPAPPTAPPAPSDVCKVCELVAAGAELFIQSHPNYTAQEVIDELNKICNISLLEKYKTECELLVSSEGAAIVNAIFAGKSASQVCSSTIPPICPSSMHSSPIGRWKGRYGRHHGANHRMRKH